MQHWNDDTSGEADIDADGIRVLLVGDDDSFVLTLRDLFREQGFRVRLAHDPRTAIARVGDGHAEVLVCDLGATRLQSIATVLALRHLGEDAPPIIAVSAMPNVEQHCKALKIEHGLSQPFRFSRLRDLAERLGRQYRHVPTERSGVFLREQADLVLDDLPELEALNFG